MGTTIIGKDGVECELMLRKIVNLLGGMNDFELAYLRALLVKQHWYNELPTAIIPDLLSSAAVIVKLNLNRKLEEAAVLQDLSDPIPCLKSGYPIFCQGLREDMNRISIAEANNTYNVWDGCNCGQELKNFSFSGSKKPSLNATVADLVGVPKSHATSEQAATSPPAHAEVLPVEEEKKAELYPSG